MQESDAGSPAKTRKGLFSRLSKTRERLASGLRSLVGAHPTVDDAWFEELQDQLLGADLGVAATEALADGLRHAARRDRLSHTDELLRALKRQLVDILRPVEKPLLIPPGGKPFVIMMVGVNGVGKTTTAAKLAHSLQVSGHTVMLAAADTYRAAAIEQLQAWGKRLDVTVIAQQHGADAAAVAHDALGAAVARGIDVLIVDTAGRQHVNDELMEQLKKVRRVLGRVHAGAPQEVLLVVDAGTGQNMVSQVRYFSAAVAVSGLCITKLDGTARGGALVALARGFGLPIRYVGVGEGLDDLRPFEALDYADALLPAALEADG